MVLQCASMSHPKFQTLVIPDRSFVRQYPGLSGQMVSVFYDALEQFIEPTRSFTKRKIIIKLAKYVSELLTLPYISPSAKITEEKANKMVADWEQHVSKGIPVPLSYCIKKDLITCFHRSVFLQILFQEHEIESCIQTGFTSDIVDSEKSPVPIEDYMKYSIGVPEWELHIWNIAYDGRVPLYVDSSMLLDKEPSISSLENFEYKSARTYFRANLGDGYYIHNFGDFPDFESRNTRGINVEALTEKSSKSLRTVLKKEGLLD